jgi:preprotein translocase SecE subunit
MQQDDASQRKQIGGFHMSLKKYVSEVVHEGKRVRWPKREDLLPSILVVVVMAAFFAAILSLEDVAVGKLLGALEEVFKSLKS